MMSIVLGLNLLILGFVIHVVYLQNQKLITLKEELLIKSKVSNLISRDHAALVTADLVFAKQLKEITKQLIGMDNQLQGLANKRNNDGGYQHALRILKMGGDRNEIINSCHLSAAEADLLINLHAYGSALETNSM
jgi:hypothetical protein